MKAQRHWMSFAFAYRHKRVPPLLPPQHSLSVKKQLRVGQQNGSQQQALTSILVIQSKETYTRDYDDFSCAQALMMLLPVLLVLVAVHQVQFQHALACALPFSRMFNQKHPCKNQKKRTISKSDSRGSSCTDIVTNASWNTGFARSEKI